MSLLTKNRHLENRKVELSELFFDLIFVYAISKIAHTILHTDHGSVSFDLFIKFLIMSLIFTTIWSYQTFFTNRFGTLHIRDVGFTMFNMFVVIYLSNSLNPDFDKTFYSFVTCTAILFFSIGLQYTIRYFMSNDTEDKGVCFVFLATTFTTSILSFTALFVPYSLHYKVFFTAIAIGMIAPLLGYKVLSASPVNMPHLVERYGLMTIIMFGEVMIGLASIFDIQHFDPFSILQFSIVVFLFWTYWIKTERFINHHQETRGFLIYHSHITIYISLGMFNAAMILSENHNVHASFKVALMFLSLALYFVGYFMNMAYFHRHHQNTKLIISTFLILFISYILSIITLQIQHSLTVITVIAIFIILLLIRSQLKKQG